MKQLQEEYNQNNYYTEKVKNEMGLEKEYLIGNIE